jgi:flagella basal body P-ring formation protein FlgA
MHRRGGLVLLALLACLHGGGAGAAPQAVLHLQVELDSGVIRVADLWSDAGPKGDMVVGPAPPPGRSIAIEAKQLVYIAELFDVAWRPVSGVERTSVERVGRPMSRDEVGEPIRRSLIEAGASPHSVVEIATFVPMLVPPLAFPVVTVEALSYDAAGQRFSANIAASSDGMQTQRLRIAGRVLQMVTAVVATHRLRPGDVIGEADVKLAELGERRIAGPVISDIGLALGQSPRRTLAEGQPLGTGDVGPPILVSKGETVVIVMETPNMSLALQGLALSAGGRDDVIQVMNPVSRAIVAAKVSGPGRAIVAPGGTPPALSASASPHPSEITN